MTLKYQRLRVPKQNGQHLQLPPLSELDSIWRDNQSLLSAQSFSVNGVDIHQLRASAQSELVEKSRAYTSRYRDVPAIPDTTNILLAGHQPTLFHPGVWYKNFVLSKMSGRLDAIGINLVIDNDQCTSSQIPVPTGSPENPRIEHLKYDELDEFIPFEMRRLNQRHLWSTFGSRVAQSIEPFVQEPLIKRLWPMVLAVEDAGLNPCCAIAAGRHCLEAEFGLQTLEIPLSQLCDTPSFAAFAAELICRSGHLREIYNQSLKQYRKLNGIRSHTHPVPELTQIDGWTEVPLWIWRDADPARRRLFVNCRRPQIRLADGDRWEIELTGRSMDEEILSLRPRGIYVRPRALMTTMYSRLVLGQLFLHGIGGAKYDQLTDLIANQLFGATCPSFFTLTSTNRLPRYESKFQASDVTAIDIKLRELVYHPERYVDASLNGADSLINRKRHLLESIPEHGSRRDWHREMESVNRAFQPLVEQNRQILAAERANLEEELARQQVLGSREFSFCVFPEELTEQLAHDPDFDEHS